MATKDCASSERSIPINGLITSMAKYSLPINATPERDAALEIKITQLTANAMEGW